MTGSEKVGSWDPEREVLNHASFDFAQDREQAEQPEHSRDSWGKCQEGWMGEHPSCRLGLRERSPGTGGFIVGNGYRERLLPRNWCRSECCKLARAKDC